MEYVGGNSAMQFNELSHSVLSRLICIFAQGFESMTSKIISAGERGPKKNLIVQSKNEKGSI